MAKEGKGFTKADEKAAGLTHAPEDPSVGNGMGKEIYKRVDRQADQDEGYSGGMPGGK